MIFDILIILFFICSIIIFTLGIHNINNAKQIDTEIKFENNIIKEKNLELLKDNERIQAQIRESQDRLNNQINEFDNILNRQQSLSRKAFENYCDILDNDYKDKEKEYDELINTLKQSYENQQFISMQQLKTIEDELNKVKATRDALVQARIKEEEIKAQKEFYMLRPSSADIEDIKKLENIKPNLHNPRILSMLIWSTFFQKPMTTLCNNILSTSIVCGIYKITNQENDMCYIGQSSDIATRWKNHAKCGLGIDAPAGNKLYKAMQEIGIWNFSWELLEECPQSQLNEKEQYYINLYNSYSYGYNSNRGVSK